MGRILRGEIYWADLNPVRGREQFGRRPILIISEDIFNQKSETVIAIAITSKQPKVGFPLTLKLKSAKLPKLSWAKIGQIRTLSTERLSKRIDMIEPEELEEIIEGLLDIIG